VYCWTPGGGFAPIASTDEFTAIYGQYYTCGIRTDGALLCWGAGFGPSPRQITGGVTWLTIADNGGCGLAVDSTAYCFGSGAAQRVGGTTRWKAIATSSRDPQCALALDGSVYCGANLETKKTPPPQPLSTLGTYWSRVGADFISDVCGLNTSGDVGCPNGWAPANLGVKLKRFYGHCAIATDDKVYCWRGFSFVLVPGQ
jgi:hypothetical protein